MTMTRGAALLALTGLLVGLLAGCGVDGVPSHPDGRPASEIEQDRNVTISGSARFGVTHGRSPSPSEGW